MNPLSGLGNKGKGDPRRALKQARLAPFGTWRDLVGNLGWRAPPVYSGFSLVLVLVGPAVVWFVLAASGGGGDWGD